MILEVIDLYVSRDDREILRGVNLKIKQGEIHAIMGPNGSGKSTLAFALMGNPDYKVTKGDIRVDGKSILNIPTDKRAKIGLFLAFQHPIELPGVTLNTLINSILLSKEEVELSVMEETIWTLKNEMLLKEKLREVGLNENYMERYVNDGFSGGEKKKSEILQMLFAKPRIAILDEIDSGLDIDSLRTIANIINSLKNETGFLIITHYNRILRYVEPDKVHVMIDGRIVASGSKELADVVEERGYSAFKKVRVYEN